MGNMITFVCGPVGAGKTTYVKENVPKGTSYLDWDEIHQLMLTYDDMLADHTSAITNGLLAEHVRFGYDLWISGTLPTKTELKILEYADDVRWIWIDTPLEQTLENIKKRNRGREAQNLQSFVKRNKDIIDKRDWFIETFNAEVVSMNEERW